MLCGEQVGKTCFPTPSASRRLEKASVVRLSWRQFRFDQCDGSRASVASFVARVAAWQRSEHWYCQREIPMLRADPQPPQAFVPVPRRILDGGRRSRPHRTWVSSHRCEESVPIRVLSFRAALRLIMVRPPRSDHWYRNTQSAGILRELESSKRGPTFLR
jgi:hypothetical protein